MKPRRRYYLIAAIVFWPVLAFAAARILVVDYPVAHPDVLVVLSGSASYNERIAKAASIYGEGRVTRIILTNDNQRRGWSPERQSNPLSYEIGLDQFARLGVPSQQIEVLSQPVYSTYDEALLVRTYLESHQLKSILLVTSPYHSRRAIWTFRHLCPNTAFGIETVQLGIDSPPPFTWWLRPKGWVVVCGEYLKLIYYWFRVG